jgi:cell wall-associated NlpC family hydrolase
MAAVLLGAVVVASLTLAPALPAGAQAVGPDTSVDDAARQVAQRRASEYRRQSELAKERTASLAVFFAAQAAAERVTPVLDKAVTGLGRPYSRGAAGPSAFDCSGFTRWAWEAAGVELPHYSGAQWAQTEHIAVEDLQPGDIVFFWGPGEHGDPSHVGLYVGDGQMIHAPGTGRPVRADSIWYWTGAKVAAGRVR